VLRSARAVPTLRQALALGLLQGPTELLPVSSSAHTTLIPLLLGWPYAELDGELRKSFEVALHAGASVALAIDMRRELLESARRLDRRRIGVVALSLAPPALAGLALRPLIARHLGGPRAIATGLAGGSAAMALAELAFDSGKRTDQDARVSDGAALGLAQALALAPGVSRYGATLAAARARGFSPAGAQTLSWHAALPVMLGASALEGARLLRHPPPDGAGLPLAAGAAAALVSTSLSARLLRRPARALRSLLPSAVYRVLLAAIVLVRMRRRRRPNADRIQ
jgi:undecaprenyl-diphosphatase